MFKEENSSRIRNSRYWYVGFIVWMWNLKMLKKPCKEPLGLVEILRFPTDLKGEEGENLKRRLLVQIQV